VSDPAKVGGDPMDERGTPARGWRRIAAKEAAFQRWLQEIESRASSEDARGWRRLVAPGLVVAGRVGSDAVGILAGSLTYGAFLSLPPLLMVMLSITGAVLKNDPGATQDVLDAVANAIPGLSTMVNTTLNVQTAQQIGIGIVGAIAVLWAASGFAARARNAFGTIFRTQRTGLVFGRVSAGLLGTPIVLLFILLAAAGSLSAGLRIVGDIRLVSELVTFVALAVASIAFTLLTYRLLTPGAGPRLVEHLPGSILFTAGWLVLHALGAEYVTRVVAKTTALYGTIGAIFGVLAFLYLTMWWLLLCAEVTQVLREREPVEASPDSLAGASAGKLPPDDGPERVAGPKGEPR
jgi:membrane protein